MPFGANSCSQSSAFPPIRSLKLWEVKAALSRWAEVGDDPADRARRRAEATRLAPALPAWWLAARDGQHCWTPPQPLTISSAGGGKPRLVARCARPDRILLGAFANRLLRFPQLRNKVPHGYAYVGGRGPRAAAVALVEQVRAAVAVFGTVTVVLFDLVRAFRNLSAFAAIERAQQWGMSRALLDALWTFYLLILENPSFSGLQEGPPTSPVLAEIALTPLDEYLRMRALGVVRFSDNIAFILPGRVGVEGAKGIVNTVVEEFRATEKVRLQTHDWRISTVTEAEGFQRPLAWLGYEWAGWTCRPSTKALQRHERALGDRVQAKGVDAATASMVGILGYHTGVVSPPALVQTARRLRRVIQQHRP
jgi:hypothetical protein